jgi:hypothetical protein
MVAPCGKIRTRDKNINTKQKRIFLNMIFYRNKKGQNHSTITEQFCLSFSFSVPKPTGNVERLIIPFWGQGTG